MKTQAHVLVDGLLKKLDWEEFEALLASASLLNPVEVVDVTGGAYATA